MFTNESSYGRLEVEFCSKIIATVRSSDDPTLDPMFLAKLYYYQQRLSQATAHFVVVPQVDLTKVSVVSAWYYCNNIFIIGLLY